MLGTFYICILLISVINCALVPYSDSRIQYIGKYATTSNGVVFSWSGVTIATSVSNTPTVTGLFSNSGSNVYFRVLIDGIESGFILIYASGSQQEYTIATGLSSATHTITLVRRNEALFGYTTFGGFGIVTGGSLVQPPARPNRRIEFIGDSITCGYGNLGTLGCSFSADTEDVYQAHPFVTARALQADATVTAWSGKGLVRNYGDGNTASVDPLPSFYSSAVGGSSQFGNWDFTSWVPHAVVINLGTNDYSTYPQPSADAYKNAYVTFINKIKSYYSPSVPAFFLVCGPMDSTYCPYAQAVATSVGGNFINLWGLNTAYGCDYHPTVAVHTNMAQVQANAIGSALGWTQVSSTTGNSGTTGVATTGIQSTTTGSPTSPPSSSSENIYTDSIQSPWQSWSWDQLANSLTNTAPVYSGSNSISFNLKGWAGLYFHRVTSFYPSSFNSFVFYVNGGNLNNVPLQVAVADATSSYNIIGTNYITNPASVVAGQWNAISIAMSSFNIQAGVQISGILIQYYSGTDSSTIYVDNVYLSSAIASTVAPTASPTYAPTAAPTATPTVKPTSAPTASPTNAPTASPTVKPTSAPTQSPTPKPTSAPTQAPTTKPTSAPTVAPTSAPTSAPTQIPTLKPTSAPTAAPTPTPRPTSSAADCINVCNAQCIKVENTAVNSWPEGSNTKYQATILISNLCSTKTLQTLTLSTTGWNPTMFWNVQQGPDNLISLYAQTTLPPNSVYSNAGYQISGSLATFDIYSYSFQ